MKPDNDWYGHKRILADYCGLRVARPIFGYLPHGWNFDIPSSIGKRRIDLAPYFVWNTRHSMQAMAQGVSNVRILGSPFVYLYEMTFGGEPPKGKGTIVFPSHSAEMNKARINVEQLVERVMADFPPPYTVSVFYQDLENPGIEFYRQSGWRMVTFGARSNPIFLHRQIVELAAHSAVAANSPQTALWYGALMARDVAIIEPRPTYESIGGAEGGAVVRRSLDRQFDQVALEYPDLMRHGLKGSAAFEVGARELGYGERLCSKELAEALGWSSWRRSVIAQMIGRINDFRVGKNVRLGELYQSPSAPSKGCVPVVPAGET